MKILLIDDEQTTLQHVKDILEGEGYETITLDDSRRAKATIEKEKPEMIISDIAMPYSSPLRLLKISKEKSIPFIILSALEQKEIIEAALDLGADAYFVKPVDPENLLEFVNSHEKKEEKISYP